jgi:hypothetical protein
MSSFFVVLALAAACGGPPEEASEKEAIAPSHLLPGPPPPKLQNGGFESGLTGWTPAGTVSIVAGGHSGNNAVMLGAVTPTQGDSTVDQTFAVPAAGGTLSFWYKMSCPDIWTIYAWAMAYVVDNTTGGGITLLQKTCRTGDWVRVSASVSSMAGHTVTLRLLSHDDDYPTDPTYTLYDDVALSPPPGTTCDTGISDGHTRIYDETGICGPCFRNHTAAPRFVDNGNQTITDRQSCLVWEKKTYSPNTSLHWVDQVYTWDSLDPASGWIHALNTENGVGFAWHTDWRLPTSSGYEAPCPLDGSPCSCNISNPAWMTCAPAELESILLSYVNNTNCSAQTISNPQFPCIDQTFGPVPSDLLVPYWSGTRNVLYSTEIWSVRFDDGDVEYGFSGGPYHVRAVRGGP